jgi:hypothetical protein
MLQKWQSLTQAFKNGFVTGAGPSARPLGRTRTAIWRNKLKRTCGWAFSLDADAYSVGQSRPSTIYLGWQNRPEPIYGRPRDWFDIKIRSGGTSPARPDISLPSSSSDGPGSTPSGQVKLTPTSAVRNKDKERIDEASDEDDSRSPSPRTSSRSSSRSTSPLFEAGKGPSEKHATSLLLAAVKN